MAWPLIICLFLQSLGQILFVYFNITPLNSTFFLNFDLSESLSRTLELSFTFGLLLFSWMLYPVKKAIPFYCSTLFTFILATALLIQDGTPFSEIVHFSWAARMALPLSLLAFINGRDSLSRLLTWSISLAFISHGLQCLMGKAEFLEFINEFSEVFSIIMPEEYALLCLYFIGAVDIIAAVLLLFNTRTFIVLNYMFYWGLLTAAIRLMSYGNMYGFTEFIVRSSHWGIPLFLLLGSRRFMGRKKKLMGN